MCPEQVRGVCLIAMLLVNCTSVGLAILPSYATTTYSERLIKFKGYKRKTKRCVAMILDLKQNVIKLDTVASIRIVTGLHHQAW